MTGRLSRRGQVQPFYAMEVLKAAAARGRSHGDVIALCVGQPSTPAPAPVLEAAAAALSSETLGYTEAVGVPALREAIAGYYQQRYALSVDAGDIMITTGSSGGFTALFLAAFDAGDVVAMTRPGYPAYRNTLAALGCRVLELGCGPEQRYQPTVAMLEQLAEPPAGLIIASPANPTGTVLDAGELARIAAWCAERGTLLISDEIYHGISYGDQRGDQRCASAWESSRDGVVVGSFSKYFSMTGWRVGWLLLPPALRRPVELLLGNLSICPPAVAQVPAVAAFDPASLAELDGHVARYAVNRELLLGRLPELGLSDLAPADGAFYIYAGIGHLVGSAGQPADATQWCGEVLADSGVALTPGIDFDTAAGGRHVRISFAGGREEIAEALDRLERLPLLRSGDRSR